MPYINIAVTSRTIRECRSYRTWANPLLVTMGELGLPAVDILGDTIRFSTITESTGSWECELPKFVVELLRRFYCGKKITPFKFRLKIPQWLILLAAANQLEIRFGKS